MQKESVQKLEVFEERNRGRDEVKMDGGGGRKRIRREIEGSGLVIVGGLGVG